MMPFHAADPPDGTRLRLPPNHRPSKLSAEPPVTSAQPLWRLVKDGHTAEARVRPIEGIGVELRYEWNGELRVSQVFKAWEARGGSGGETPRTGSQGLALRLA